MSVAVARGAQCCPCWQSPQNDHPHSHPATRNELRDRTTTQQVQRILRHINKQEADYEKQTTKCSSIRGQRQLKKTNPIATTTPSRKQIPAQAKTMRAHHREDDVRVSRKQISIQRIQVENANLNTQIDSREEQRNETVCTVAQSRKTQQNNYGATNAAQKQEMRLTCALFVATRARLLSAKHQRYAKRSMVWINATKQGKPEQQRGENNTKQRLWPRTPGRQQTSRISSLKPTISLRRCSEASSYKSEHTKCV